MTINVRCATADDKDAVARFVLDAGAGIFEQLFNGLVPGINALDVLRLGAVDSSNPVRVDNATLVENNDEVVGCIVCYSSDLYGLPAVAETLIPKRRRAPLAGLLASRFPGSYYINTVAVSPKAQGMGLGRLLVETALNLAQAEGYEYASLHAWHDNPSAMAIYESLGFEVRESFEIAATKYLQHDKPVSLLVVRVPDALARMGQ